MVRQVESLLLSLLKTSFVVPRKMFPTKQIFIFMFSLLSPLKWQQKKRRSKGFASKTDDDVEQLKRSKHVTAALRKIEGTRTSPDDMKHHLKVLEL